MDRKLFIPVVAALVLAFSCTAFAQFGGRPGDVVIYAVTYNGSGAFQVVPPTTVNSAASTASFHVTSLDSVPYTDSDPFPLKRQVFYMTNSETFQVGSDFENTVGLHRVVTYPTKIFEFDGLTAPFGTALGWTNTFILYPKGLDVQDDIALKTIRVITWFPGPWPFIVPTDIHGPLSPDIPGYVYLFTTPGLISLPSLMPWTGFSVLYPGAGWPSGVDLKLLDEDQAVGDTIRQLRLRPGKQTPPFRTAGHTHLFVLQGSMTITPAGSSPVVMNQHDYAYLPESFAVTLSNPVHYSGIGAQ